MEAMDKATAAEVDFFAPAGAPVRRVPSSSSPYGRGPGSLRYAATKQAVVASAAFLLVFVPIVFSTVCLWNGFCFAEEQHGLRVVYAQAPSRAVVPVGVALLVSAALTLVAAHLSVLAVSLTAWLVNGVLCAFLVVVAIGTFALLPAVGTAASETWSQLPVTVQQHTYGSDAGRLQTQMVADIAAVAVSALTGAVLTGLVALLHYPIVFAQLRAYKRGGCWSISPIARTVDKRYDEEPPPSAWWPAGFSVLGAAGALFAALTGPCFRAGNMPAPALPTATQVRTRLLTSVATWCGRPGLAVASMCLGGGVSAAELQARTEALRAAAAAPRPSTVPAAAGAAGGAVPGAVSGSALPVASTASVPAPAEGMEQGAGVGALPPPAISTT